MWAAKLRKHDMEAQWWLPLQYSLREPRPLFETMILLAANGRESRPLFLYCICTLQFPFTASCSEPCPLLLQELSMPRNIHVQQTYSLHEATSTYKSHVFMSTSLRVATPTNPSVYLLAYREYTLLGTWNALFAQFLSVFHSLPIQATSGSHPGLNRIAIRVTGSAVVTQFQRWCKLVILTKRPPGTKLF